MASGSKPSTALLYQSSDSSDSEYKNLENNKKSQEHTIPTSLDASKSTIDIDDDYSGKKKHVYSMHVGLKSTCRECGKQFTDIRYQ